MLVRAIVSLVLFLLAPVVVAGQTQQQISNVETFSELYGYVRYFHPSDESSTIDWDAFAIFGAAEVINAQDSKELHRTFLRIFTPIAPSLQIVLNGTSKAPVTFNSELTGGVTWQHLGVALGNPQNIYRSKKVSTSDTTEMLYPEHCRLGEFISKDIGSNISITLPLTLPMESEGTSFNAKSSALKEFKEQLEQCKREVQSNRVPIRLAALVITSNILNHFHPHVNPDDMVWRDAFVSGVVESFDESIDLGAILKKFTAFARDGHVRVRRIDQLDMFLPPMNWEWREGKLIVTGAFGDSTQLKVGDIVQGIDGKSTNEYFKHHVYPLVSASTNGWLKFRACQEALSGFRNSKLALKISSSAEERVVYVNRTLSFSDHYSLIKSSAATGRISSDIYYVNLVSSTWPEIQSILPQLCKVKNIIFDCRGYPNANNHNILKHLLSSADTSSQWMRVPKIIYPNQKPVVGYLTGGWHLKLESPHIDAKVIFLINGKAISYAESLLSFVEHYRLGTTIGETTAGTNGNTNEFFVPGGYRVTFTGMCVLKHDGSPLHGVGILPDIVVPRTISGLINNRDEALEKAIQLINSN